MDRSQQAFEIISTTMPHKYVKTQNAPKQATNESAGTTCAFNYTRTRNKTAPSRQNEFNLKHLAILAVHAIAGGESESVLISMLAPHYIILVLHPVIRTQVHLRH